MAVLGFWKTGGLLWFRERVNRVAVTRAVGTRLGRRNSGRWRVSLKGRKARKTRRRRKRRLEIGCNLERTMNHHESNSYLLTSFLFFPWVVHELDDSNHDGVAVGLGRRVALILHTRMTSESQESKEHAACDLPAGGAGTESDGPERTAAASHGSTRRTRIHTSLAFFAVCPESACLVEVFNAALIECSYPPSGFKGQTRSHAKGGTLSSKKIDF